MGGNPPPTHYCREPTSPPKRGGEGGGLSYSFTEKFLNIVFNTLTNDSRNIALAGWYSKILPLAHIQGQRSQQNQTFSLKISHPKCRISGPYFLVSERCLLLCVIIQKFQNFEEEKHKENIKSLHQAEAEKAKAEAVPPPGDHLFLKLPQIT